MPQAKSARRISVKDIRAKPHPEQGFRTAMGVLSLARRYEHERLETACERALIIQALSYSSVNSILKSGLDRTKPVTEADQALPLHTNIRGRSYYH